MLGGYQILDLTNIDLELTDSAQNITDTGVLNQLRNLREYIEDNYDFTRPLNNKLKPLLIRLRDKKADEKIESSVWGNIAITAFGFIISATVLNSPLTRLEINVEFQLSYDDDGNPYYDIDSATIQFTGEITINGDLKAFENIVDKDGHKRFIEGDIELHSSLPAGITKKYGKWSLSGTHLILVLAGEIESNTTVSGNTFWFDLILPQWILDKIIPVVNPYVTYKNIVVTSTGFSTSDNFNVVLNKGTLNTIYVAQSGSKTFSNAGSFRMEFNLLIDNE